jgi:transposase
MNQQLSKVKSTLKRVTDPVIRERLLMVQSAIKHPLRDAAREFGCVHGKIAYWKNRYLKHGLKGLYTMPRSGRPSKMKPEQIKLIKRKVRRHNPKQGWTTKHIRSLIHKEAGVAYTSRHVLRISQSWGLSQIKPRKRSAYSKQEDREAFIKKTSPS